MNSAPEPKDGNKHSTRSPSPSPDASTRQHEPQPHTKNLTSPTYRAVDGYGRTSFPFAVTVESSDPINIGLDFDQGEFDEVEAACFLDHYATLLASIVASPDAPVSTLTMLTDGERQDLTDYNDTTRSVPFASVIDAFRAQVESTSAEPAVVCGAEVLSYAELDVMSERLATRIIRVGRFNAKRVALYLPRSPDMVAAMLGVLKAGAAYVPVDRHLPASGSPTYSRTAAPISS